MNRRDLLAAVAVGALPSLGGCAGFRRTAPARKTAWSATTGRDEPVRTPLTLAHGRVYAVGEGGTLLAIDAETGAFDWSADVGERAFAGVRVDGDTLYTGSNTVHAFDRNGTRQWSTDLDERGAPYATGRPLVFDDAVVVGTNVDAMYGLDAATGAVRWEAEPVVGGVDDYARVGESVLTADVEGAVSSVDPADGSVRWRHPVDPPVSLSVANGVAYATGGTTVRAFASSGEELWRSPLPTIAGKEVLAPAVGDGNVYVGGRVRRDVRDEPVDLSEGAGYLAAYHAADGRHRWTVERPGLTCPPGTDDGSVFVGHRDDTLRCLTGDGDRRWTHGLDSGVATRPVTDGDRVYVGTGGGSVVAVER